MGNNTCKCISSTNAICAIDVGMKNFGVCIISNGKVTYLDDIAIVPLCCLCEAKNNRVMALYERGGNYYCKSCSRKQDVKGRIRRIDSDVSTLATATLAAIKKIPVKYNTVVIESQPTLNKEMTKLQYIIIGIFVSMGIPCSLVSSRKIEQRYLPDTYESMTKGKRYAERKKAAIKIALDELPSPWREKLIAAKKQDDMADAYILAKNASNDK